MKLSRTGIPVAALAVCLLTACNSGTPSTDTIPASPVDGTGALDAPAGQLPQGITPTAYRLDLKADPAAPGFSGTVEIDVSLDAPARRVWLHSVDQDILYAVARLPDGTELSASFTGDQAPDGVSRLDFSTPLPAGTATLILDYTAPYNFGLAGLYKVSRSGEDYLATQMEAIDARRMVPSFDEPRFKTPWTLAVTVPQGNKVIANGALEFSQLTDDSWVRHEFATTRPIQSYLVALAVGPYDVLHAEAIPASLERTDPVPFRAFAVAGKGDKLEEAVAITDDMLLWQEEYFDYPYPYGKLDLIAAAGFAYGAMENAGAIIYREASLLIDERTSLARRRAIFTTHAHELGHQWFGNLVTPAWWDDIWLNEAFATWISYKTMHNVDPDGDWQLSPILAGLSAMPADSLVNARQIRNPILTNGDINSAFDSITYRKGGSVLNMFETYVGEDAFRDGIRLHMRRFEDGVADVEDFMQSLAEGSGHSEIIDSFSSFIFQPGIPLLDVQLSCPAPDAGLITITQSRYAPLGSTIDKTAQTWDIPFAARLNGPAGDRVIRQIISDETTEIPVDGDCPDWVMPNAGGTGYWRISMDEDNLSALTQDFTRLSAGEQIVLTDALTSGFKSGDVDAGMVLEGLAASAAGHPYAAKQPLSVLDTFSNQLDEDGKDRLAKWVEQTYGPLATRLDAKDKTGLSAPEALLETSLDDVLLNHGNSEARRAAMLAMAQAYIGFEGIPDSSALAPGQLSQAMNIGIEDGGTDFFDTALAYALRSDNETERATIFAAIGEHAAPQALGAFLDLSLTENVSGNEMRSMVLYAFTNKQQEAVTWPFVKDNFDAIIARLPEVRKPQFASITRYACTAEQSADMESFLLSKADLMPGYERPLAQGLETSALCSALRSAKADEIAALFTSE